MEDDEHGGVIGRAVCETHTHGCGALWLLYLLGPRVNLKGSIFSQSPKDPVQVRMGLVR